MRAYEGVYYSPEVDTFYTVALAPSGGLVLRNGRVGDTPLKYFGPDLFVSDHFPQIRFAHDNGGTVSNLRIALGRISNGVEFRRISDVLSRPPESRYPADRARASHHSPGTLEPS